MRVCKYYLLLEHSTHNPSVVVGAKDEKLHRNKAYNRPPYDEVMSKMGWNVGRIYCPVWIIL